jgi:hypothetical protein
MLELETGMYTNFVQLISGIAICVEIQICIRNNRFVLVINKLQ